ncbi:hypothetical protein NJBCHELONAE_16920 [Mycobacteroides chelonae]|nr:hypothetical protein NJBCHELONAE_16920 [Mycobacteroides chelonae]
MSAEAIADLDVSEHVRAILITIADLSNHAHHNKTDALAGIGRWLHTLGYRGHITTKSRRYSTTMGKLRAVRATWTRQQAAKHAVEQTNPEQRMPTDRDKIWWAFDRAGHSTSGDRTLVVSAALRHIHTRRIGLSEYRLIGREGGEQ